MLNSSSIIQIAPPQHTHSAPLPAACQSSLQLASLRLPGVTWAAQSLTLQSRSFSPEDPARRHSLAHSLAHSLIRCLPLSTSPWPTEPPGAISSMSDCPEAEGARDGQFSVLGKQEQAGLGSVEVLRKHLPAALNELSIQTGFLPSERLPLSWKSPSCSQISSTVLALLKRKDGRD